MAEQIVQITEGAGKKLHTYERVIGANTVQDEVVVLGEQYLASYSIQANPVATGAGAHVLQLMAGSSLKVRVRRILIFPSGSTAAVNDRFQILRVTTAGTGGAAITPSVFDPADAAAGAAGMSGVVTPGTEGAILLHVAMPFTAAAPETANYWEWRQVQNQKPLVIAAGTSNGIVIKNIAAVTGGGVVAVIEFDESNF